MWQQNEVISDGGCGGGDEKVSGGARGSIGDDDDLAEVSSPSMRVKPFSGPSGCSGNVEVGAWLNEDVERERRYGGENALLRWCERLAEAMEDEEGSGVVD